MLTELRECILVNILLLAQSIDRRSASSGLDRCLFTTIAVSVVDHVFVFLFIIIDEAIHLVLIIATVIHALIVLWVVKNLLECIVSGCGDIFVLFLLMTLLQTLEFLK